MSGRTWLDREPCGTSAAWRRHYRDGEVPCGRCRWAERQYRILLRERKAKAAAASPTTTTPTTTTRRTTDDRA